MKTYGSNAIFSLKPPLILSIRRGPFPVLLWLCLKLSIYLHDWSPQQTKSLRARILFYHLVFRAKPSTKQVPGTCWTSTEWQWSPLHSRRKAMGNLTTVYSEPACSTAPATQGQMSALQYVRQGVGHFPNQKVHLKQTHIYAITHNRIKCNS